MTLICRSTLRALLESDLHDVARASKSTCPISNSVLSFKIKRQLDDLNRKQDLGSISSDLIEDAELNLQRLQDKFQGFTPFEDDRLVRARNIIYSLLPPLEHVISDVFDSCDFGPGTIFHARSLADRSLYRKISGPQSITPMARSLLPYLFEAFPNWVKRNMDNRVEIVQGNRIAYVPKDIRKCRLIAVEPSLNVFIQKGIGSWLTRHLRRMNFLDLIDGQEYHRSLVRDSYDSICTIDLSNASDTISIALVKSLLPPDWFNLLDAARSHCYKLKGKWHNYTTFSSQGNAFTFPLEALIFKALAMAASDLGNQDISVYGDDIIAPKDSFPCITSFLEECGFEINREKSFSGQHAGLESFFRESCGEDTLFGRSVRSYFYKVEASHPTHIFAIANGLYDKWGHLPRVHCYLVSSLAKPIFGPRRFWGTNSSNVFENTYGETFSYYFWDEIDPDNNHSILKWNKHTHAFTRKVLLYLPSKNKEIHARFRTESSDVSAFLYAPSSFLNAPSHSVKFKLLAKTFAVT